MAQHLTDEEQLQILKNWWKDNGFFLVICLAVAASAYLGWQAWQRHQQNYAHEASALYVELIDAVSIQEGEALSDDKHTTARFLITQLQDDYSGSMYAFHASLLGAKLAVDKADLPLAEQQLLEALELSDDQTRPIVNLRLAKIYLAQSKYDEALEAAAYEAEDSFTTLFASVRGDIHVAKGDKAAAREAYEQALATLNSESDLQKRVLGIKLADLGEG